LTPRPAGRENRSVRTFPVDDGILIRFHDLPGRGAPLLFVHGLGCASSCDYPAVAADPALSGRRMLLVDLLGSGFSDRPERFGYAVEDHARVLATLIDGLHLCALDVFGHSMGGSVAIALAALGKGRVARLVVGEPNLVAGGGAFSRPIAAWHEAAYVAGGHAETVREARARGDRVWAGSLLTSAPLAVHRGAASLVRGSSPSWLEQLATLSIPRTALYGERSLPDPDAERLERIGVVLRVVPGCGHSMAWENPSGLACAIAANLA
jgi:pimeloyl-ACP methyl ester carboxylesterase